MKKSIIPLLAVLFFGCSNDFSDSSIDVLRSEKEDSVERVDKSWVLIFSDEFNIDGAVDSKKWNYGAQNEAYMSRSAEKLARGLCFNELGVGG